MPESELDVLVEASLSDFSDSRVASSASLSASFCRGSGTGNPMLGPGCSSVTVCDAASFLGKGVGVVVVGLMLSGDWSPSKLV